MRHSADYLELFSTSWSRGSGSCRRPSRAKGSRRATGSRDFYEGKLAAAQYWIRTELPKIAALVALCRETKTATRG